MKLWMVMLVFQQVNGVAGPLPYSLEECRNRAAEFVQIFQEQYGEGTRVDVQGRSITPDDFTVECWERELRPKIDLK